MTGMGIVIDGVELATWLPMAEATALNRSGDSGSAESPP